MSALALTALLALAADTSPAPPPGPPTPWQFTVRADPVVFALLGASVGVDAAPADSHWRLSLAAFHVVVPELLVPVVVQPSAGVVVTEDAVQLGAFYDLDVTKSAASAQHGGWFVGPELYVYALTYALDGDVATAREAYAHVTGGYTWYPLSGVPVAERLFLQPWATIGVPIFHSGGANVAGTALRDRILNWHATVSLGVRVW